VSLPFSPSADRNKEAIGDALKAWLVEATNVFEFGSGTGQHAVYLCQRFPHLRWQPSELKQNLEAIGLQIQRAGLRNVCAPIEWDVLQRELPVAATASGAHTTTVGDSAANAAVDYQLFSFAYSANTAHIMSMAAVARMMSAAAALLQPAGHFALYGPFCYGSRHTAEGNVRFDGMLREQDAAMGVRDKFELVRLAKDCGMTATDDLAMPSNNRILIWQKQCR